MKAAILYSKFFVIFCLIASLQLLIAGELRFLTINVWSGLDYQGTLKMGEYETRERREQRYQLLLQRIRVLTPDVIALNEANRLPAYARRLARDLEYDQIHTVGNAGIKLLTMGIPTNLIEGDVILARKSLQLERVGLRKLSGDRLGVYSDLLAFHFSESNFVIIGKIKGPSGELYVANTHLHASVLINEEIVSAINRAVAAGTIEAADAEQMLKEYRQRARRREQELQELFDFIEAHVPSEAALVLMGDFNDVPGSSVYRQIRNRGFIDSYALHTSGERGFTWNPAVNTNIDPLQLERLRSSERFEDRVKYLNDRSDRRIDYIFLRNIGPDRIIESSVVFDSPRNGMYLSDHFGVFCRIQYSTIDTER